MFSANNLKTVALLAFLTGLLVLVGRLLGGPTGMIIAFGFALIMNFGAWWFSDKLALKMSGARPVTEDEEPELYAMTRQLVQRANMPMPALYVIDDWSPNAFATGRDPQHSAVAVTRGIQQLLSPYELAGVIAHELAHIKNRDTLISTVVATFAGAISFIANMAQWALIFGGLNGNNDDEDNGANLVGGIAMMIVAPIIATLVQLAISRAREFEADATGARIMGDPESLASALARLERGIAMQPMATQPATAHLYIANPFGMSNVAKLFSTHPPMAERIAKLRSMSPADYLRAA